ncbi:hydrolase [Deinococcus irradiatisoli]|uniref:Hydrolase n=1 Tax=Deinococcus irradiatisoli TaxID=2202254 RepID=A0A2Z3JSU6_9DEIO|nr:alpha/beta hydrolase [Deinococcus irradiatisoli]AWN24308.1 hydrolase [Deinococcus irradiatisoli]
MTTTDHVVVHGEFTPVKQPRGVVLLLHMLLANRHEYDNIAKRLATEGYASLALDARYGDTWNGFDNETVNSMKAADRNEAGSLLDVNAAYAWLKKQYPASPMFVLGSSIGASLAIPFAAQHPKLAGVLAFAPDMEIFEHLNMPKAAQSLRLPVFIACNETDTEQREAKALFEAVGSKAKTLFVLKGTSVHGARVLDPKTMVLFPELSAIYWPAVLKFLRSAGR